MMCWSLDVTVEEGRAHVGIETQRQRSDRATKESSKNKGSKLREDVREMGYE
jgi:KaiC/GvpD/RAD55 family RecA-like ATPase